MKKLHILILLFLLLAVNLYQVKRYKNLKIAYISSRVAPSISTANSNKVKQMIVDELIPVDVTKVELEDGDSTSQLSVVCHSVWRRL